MTDDASATRAALRITCADAVERVTDFLEDALAPEDLERFRAHLAGCEACAVYLDQIRRTVTIVGALRDEDYTLAPSAAHRLTEAFRRAAPDA